jgi:hypothetical protein
MTEITQSRKTTRKGDTLSSLSGHAHNYIGALTVPGFEDGTIPLLSFILKVLDGERRHMVRQHLECFLYFDFQMRTPEMDKFIEHLKDDPGLLVYAIDSMIATMRVMADMWIDSGKSGTDRDVDTPADRNVEDTLPKRPCSLFLMIDRILLRNYPPRTNMRRDGSLEIENTYPRFDSEMLQWGHKTALEEHGKRWAAFRFSQLLDSPYSRHISRCDYCKSYFAYRRARLRTVKHGVFCPDCEAKASVKRTEVSRSNAKTPLIETAAQKWIEWEAKSRHLAQAQWVAYEVNKRHSTRYGARWVTQNWNKNGNIQKRVEELRNAKG